MHPADDLRAILRLFATYLALVAAVCAVRAAAAQAPAPAPAILGALAAVHAGAAVVLLRRARLAAAPTPGAGRLLLPYGLWLVSWIVLGRVFNLTAPAVHDGSIAAADLALLGGPWHRQLAMALPAPGLDLVMQATYLSYYLIIVGPPAVLALRGRRAACERYTLHVMAAYLACFAVYLVWPVLGPRAAADLAGGGAAGGLADLAALARRVGDSAGTAFPSSHCAASLAAALAAGAYVRLAGRIALAGWALLISVATVYTGNHYALDAVAGLLLALGVHAAVSRRPPAVAGSVSPHRPVHEPAQPGAPAGPPRA